MVRITVMQHNLCYNRFKQLSLLKIFSEKKFEKIWSERIPKIKKVQSQKLETPAPQKIQITAMPSSVDTVIEPLHNCTIDDLDADDLD